MQTTIDAAGRIVIPKSLRDAVGLRPGPVEVVVDGAGVRVAPIATDVLDELDGRVVIPSTGLVVDDEAVRALRDADQR